MASARITKIASKVTFGIMCFVVVVVVLVFPKGCKISWNFMMMMENERRERDKKRREIE